MRQINANKSMELEQEINVTQRNISQIVTSL